MEPPAPDDVPAPPEVAVPVVGVLPPPPELLHAVRITAEAAIAEQIAVSLLLIMNVVSL
jgi:hypothetical protein